MSHVVVVRMPARYPCERKPPAIALIVKRSPGKVRVRLWQRATLRFESRWARTSHDVPRGLVARDATAREALLGVVIEPVPLTLPPAHAHALTSDRYRRLGKQTYGNRP